MIKSKFFIVFMLLYYDTIADQISIYFFLQKKFLWLTCFYISSVANFLKMICHSTRIKNYLPAKGLKRDNFYCMGFIGFRNSGTLNIKQILGKSKW